MRTVSAAGDAITFMSDEKEIEAISGKVMETMREHGYSQIEKLGRKPVIAFIIQLGCRRWEKGERRLIIEEGIRLLNETISKSLLG